MVRVRVCRRGKGVMYLPKILGSYPTPVPGSS